MVLAPTSLLEGWKRELAKYTLLNVSVAKTGAEAAQAAYADAVADATAVKLRAREQLRTLPLASEDDDDEPIYATATLAQSVLVRLARQRPELKPLVARRDWPALAAAFQSDNVRARPREVIATLDDVIARRRVALTWHTKLQPAVRAVLMAALAGCCGLLLLWAAVAAACASC